LLPFEFKIFDLKSADDVYFAIRNMVVRGAPLIGVTAAFGIYLALVNPGKSKLSNEYILEVAKKLESARPTAVNLKYAIKRQMNAIKSNGSPNEKAQIALKTAGEMLREEREYCRQIGLHGLALIEKLYNKKSKKTVNILTHCNAGWLACIDYGTATAPIYFAHDKGINVHVWVDETRPRNQGARLTTWELDHQGVPYTLITDNAGGYLMQQGLVDLVIVGSDRTALTGNVVNKIGTYLKALAANDNNVPFYVALPESSIDWQLQNKLNQVQIERRSAEEIMFVEGSHENKIKKIRICPENARIANFGFDVTPARLITGLITDRGICKAKKEDILKLFPEYS
jgi:methylthioribose-1-phosphate isomerase